MTFHRIFEHHHPNWRRGISQIQLVKGVFCLPHSFLSELYLFEIFGLAKLWQALLENLLILDQLLMLFVISLVLRRVSHLADDGFLFRLYATVKNAAH